MDKDRHCIWTQRSGRRTMATYSKGSLRERGKGYWQARFCRTDANGSTIVARSFEASSKRAATLRMQDIRQDLIEANSQQESSSDLIAYMSAYVDSRELGGQIEASTATNYRSSIKHIARYLTGFELGEVTPKGIVDMQAGLLREGLVPDTVAKDHRFLKQVMDYAADVGHIQRSPFVKAVKPPKRRKPQPNPLDTKSREALLAALDASPTSRQSVAARLGLLAGLRREEVAGLRWNDIDFKEGTMTIRRAVGMCDGKAYLKGTKTDAGQRTVVMERSLVSVLSRLRDEGDMATITEDLYVLGNGGSFYNPDRITKDFTSMAKMMGLTGVAGRRATFHDLRDTFATHLITSGVNVKTVSYLLGHANAAMTLNVYTSNTPAGMDAAAKALESLTG